MYLFSGRFTLFSKVECILFFIELVLFPLNNLSIISSVTLVRVCFSLAEKQNGARRKSWCLFFEVSPDEGARTYDRVRERDGRERATMRREMGEK